MTGWLKAAMLVFLGGLNGFPAQATQPIDPAKAAYEAAGEAARAAELARLIGSAEGLYRGCLISQRWRHGEHVREELRTAEQLASYCEAHADAVSQVLGVSDAIRIDDFDCVPRPGTGRAKIVDAVVSVVRREPLLVAEHSGATLLTKAAILSVSSCSRPHLGR